MELFEDSWNSTALDSERAVFEEFFPNYPVNPVSGPVSFAENLEDDQAKQAAGNWSDNHMDGIPIYWEAPITDQLQLGTRANFSETQTIVQHVEGSNSRFSKNEFFEPPAQFNYNAQYPHDVSLPTVPQELLNQQPATKKQACLQCVDRTNLSYPIDGTLESPGIPTSQITWNSHDGNPPTALHESPNQQSLAKTRVHPSQTQYQTNLYFTIHETSNSAGFPTSQTIWNAHDSSPPNDFQDSGHSSTRKRALEESNWKQRYQYLNDSYQKLYQEHTNLKELLNGSPVGKLLDANEKAEFYKKKYEESERLRVEEQTQFEKAIQQGVGSVGNVDERRWYKAVFKCEDQMIRISGMSFFPECFFSADRLPRALPQQVESIPQPVDVKLTLNGKESDCKQYRKLISTLRTQQTKQINDGYIVLKTADVNKEVQMD